VVTKTTELATEVYSKELIQEVKCMARKNPARPALIKSSRWSIFNSGLFLIKAKGTRTRLAITNLEQAITIEDASLWANRIKIDAVETNNIPNAEARTGLYMA
jgi:hypothetical protein